MASPTYLPGSRYGIRAWDGANTLISDIDTASQTMRDDIESLVVGYKSGTHAARLAATNVDGMLWRETDTGLIYLGTGAIWIALGASLRGTAAALPAANAALDGAFYWAYDTKVLYRCYGTTPVWESVTGGQALVGTRVLAAGTVVSAPAYPGGQYAVVWVAPSGAADPLGMWSAGNPSRLTVPVGYGGSWMVGFTDLANYSIGISGSYLVTGGGSTFDSGHAEFLLAAGDYCEVVQNSSSFSGTVKAYSPTFAMRRVASA